MGGKEEAVPWYKHVLNNSVLVICLICFIAFEYSHWKLYIEKETTTKVAYIKHNELQFPFMVICPTVATIDGRPYNGFQNWTAIDAISPPLEIINDGPSLFQDNTVNGTFRYEIMDFYTLYNGKCKGIRIIDPVPIRVAFKFYIGPKPVTIFLLRDLTEVLNLVGQTFFPDANLFKIDENAILQMEKESYAFKSIESRPCQEVMFEDFGQCVMDGLEDVLINRGVECAPPHLEPLLPKFKGKNCSDPDEIKNIMLMASKELSSISIGKSDIKCAFPCTLDYIKATKVDFSVEDPNTADSFLFLPRFSNGYVKTTSEYFIYTPFTILTATGGAMGMFLGWSVYQNHKVLLNIIEMVVIKLCKRRM